MNKIGRVKVENTPSKACEAKPGNKQRQSKCSPAQDADTSALPTEFIGIGAFAKSLILCGIEASCIESLTGLPQAAVAKLFTEAAAEREEEFKASAKALAQRRLRKVPAYRPGNRQPYTGGRLWRKKQANGSAADCFRDCGQSTPAGERLWEGHSRNTPDSFLLHIGA
jgi:hypothetical protein